MLVSPYSFTAAASDSSIVNTGGSARIFGVIDLAAANASARVGAATMASASSTCMTVPPIGTIAI